MNISNQQTIIKNWFNRTYEKRGNLYLRNINAYYIFGTLLKFKTNDNFLDIGSGLGRMIEVGLKYKVNCFGIDISDYAVNFSKNKYPQATICLGNAENLNFPNQFFNKISCLGVLERIIDKKKLLDEMQRVGNKDSIYCIMVRNSLTLKWFIKTKFNIINQKGHQGAFSIDEWKNLFISNGFNVLHIYPDQWPIKKLLFCLSFGLYKNFKSLSKTVIPIKYSGEFIFILKKK